MENTPEKDGRDVEKEKHVQNTEEKKPAAGTSQNASGSEATERKKSNSVIKSSTSASSSSSVGNCTAHSQSSTDLYPRKSNARKRKHSRNRSRSVKKVRISKRRKSFNNRRKKVNKKVNRARPRNRNKKCNKKSKDERKNVKKRENKCKTDDDAYKKEYNKKLDALARYGRNFYCPSLKQKTGLRPIYIDGSNVAYSHGQNERFSVKGLKICIDYFRKRGHTVKAFVPHFRLRRGETTDQQLLHELVNKKLVITTPTLYIQNQRRSPYDDWYIVQSAAANGGIIISADNFQDIIKWNPNLRSVIEECRLVPTFVDDMLIFPVDPHGNRQNNLDQFLRF